MKKTLPDPQLPDNAPRKGTTDTEKQVLLTLSRQMALVNDKEHLLSLLNTELRNVFDYLHSNIVRLSDDGETFSAFLTDPNAASKDHAGYGALLVSRFSTHDALLDNVLPGDMPYIFDLEAADARGNLPLYLTPALQSGAIEMVSIRLMGDKGIFGVLSFFSAKKDIFSPHIEFIGSIASQVSVAISNIVAHEQIRKRDADQKKLLSLSHKMAKVRDKAELIALINKELKKLFYFAHSSVTVINEDRRTFCLYLTDPSSRTKGHSGYQELITEHHAVADGVYDTILASDKPTVSLYEELLELPEPPSYVKVQYEAGIREAVSIPMHSDKDIWAVLHFFSDRTGVFSPEDIEIMRGIASQVSVAISNVMANEEIMVRQAEKEMLLSLSYEMAAIRNKEDLLHVINTDLKKLFYFCHSSIVTIDATNHFTVFLTDPDSRSRQHADYETVINTRFPVEDGIVERYLRSPEPMVTDIEELARTGKLLGYSRLHYEVGLKEWITFPLHNEKGVFGILTFYSDRKGSFDANCQHIIKAISGQVSIATANIIANEEIRRRETEKEMLLSLSHEMARILDKDKLLAVINTKLRELLYFSHTSIQVVDYETETFTVFFTDPDSPSRKHPGFEDMVTTPHSIHDSVFSRLIASDEIVLLNVEEMAALPDAPSYVKIHHAIGLKEAASIALFGENEKIFGVLTFYSDKSSVFGPESSTIIKSVANQVSIAVSNILAHQAVRHREKEKESLLSVSNDMATIRNLKDLQKLLPKKLREFFDFDDVFIGLYNETGTDYLMFLSDMSRSGAPLNDLATVAKSYSGKRPAIDQFLGRYGNTVVKENDTLWDTSVMFSFLREEGLNEAVILRLVSGGSVIGFMCILAKKERTFFDSQLALMKGIADQVSIGITNILANERIIRQLEEINQYKQQLEQENLYLQQEIDTVNNYTEIVGSGPEMQKIYRLVSQVAPTGSTVLITGETGTGKELVARAIHDSSPRKSKIMIKVNCAALPPHLIESELFGHERGSFTGATERRIGKFELANKSTLFLDEIGELPLELQVKLLRALQEKEIERVGGRATISTDVRIIAATNRDLQKEVYNGNFRSDLYYRLNVFPIALPSLRERVDDIPVLTQHFINRFSKSAKRPISGVSSKVMQQMRAYSWPGNVRELEHLIERSVLLTEGNLIRSVLLPGKKHRQEDEAERQYEFKPKTMFLMEKEYILQVLKYCKGRVQGPGGAAELLDMPPTTLHSRMKKLGIQKGHY